MKTTAIMFSALTFCLTAHAEWFEVQSVISYNQIVASRPNAPANTIKIRIKNLENIEDIQMDRSKVLLSGKSTIDLAKDSLLGQLVWVEDLKEESGIHVGNVYLSYEQMIRGYAKQRMVGGQTVPPEVKAKLEGIFKVMLRNINTSANYEDDALFLQAFNQTVENNNRRAVQNNQQNPAQIKTDPRSYFSYDVCYTHEYLKGIFVYEALNWFKDEGQFLPADIQAMFVDWLASYQGAGEQRAKGLEMKIRDMTVRYELYKDFLLGD